MGKKIRLTESEFRNMISGMVRNIVSESYDSNRRYSREEWNDVLKGVSDKSAELDDRLAKNTDESLYPFCDQLAEKAGEVERRFKEAKMYKKQAAAELDQAVEPIRNRPVIVYAKKRGSSSQGYIKIPASIEKIDWFGENIYIHYQPISSWNDKIIEVMSSADYDFSSIRIIPISDEEGASFRSTSPFGQFSDGK